MWLFGVEEPESLNEVKFCCHSLLKKWTAYGARNWEVVLAGGLLQWNRPFSLSWYQGRVGEQKKVLLPLCQNNSTSITNYFYNKKPLCYHQPTSTTPPTLIAVINQYFKDHITLFKGYMPLTFLSQHIKLETTIGSGDVLKANA